MINSFLKKKNWSPLGEHLKAQVSRKNSKLIVEKSIHPLAIPSVQLSSSKAPDCCHIGASLAIIQLYMTDYMESGVVLG